MRLHPGMIAICTMAGLGMACEKNEPVAPQAAPFSAPSPTEPSNPTLPSAVDRDREPPDEADRRGPVNRSEAIKVMLSKMESGDFGPAFQYLDEDIVWTEIGLPNGEFDTVAKVADYHRRARAGFSDFKLRAGRVLDSADYQVVEYVWSARHTGTFADGTAPTNKTATVPGAMLVRYQDDGLIDRVWVFQDWPNAIQQLGLAPGLPADFKASMLPERTELISGKLDSSVASSYGTFASRMGRDVYLQALADHASDDFSIVNHRSGQLVKDREAMLAYFGERVGSFEVTGTNVETLIGAGDYFAAFITHDYVYRGGFMGVLADDQKVVTHTLDVVRFDPATLRFKSLATYGNSMEILSALGLGATSGTRPEGGHQAFEIGACDRYVEKTRACLETVDTDKRTVATRALDEQIVRWHGDTEATDRDQRLGTSCESAMAAARTDYGASCPRVTWD